MVVILAFSEYNDCDANKDNDLDCHRHHRRHYHHYHHHHHHQHHHHHPNFTNSKEMPLPLSSRSNRLILYSV